ncbi:transglycosylase domain-containing protein [Bacillus massiliigorillae]|uniref:transglycosylase domain-containing protein n=1 Tax=Bacillus massiliigorillae TaxID=1243664 RepID=UPI00039E5AA9|nr:PBP1A family penicillin-binding protein [Bacillus massiliigorillae]
MADNFQTREERRKSQQQNKKSRKSKKPSKKSTSIWKRILLVFSIIVLVGIIAGGATFAYFVSSAPKLDEALLKDPVSSKIFYTDKDGNKKFIEVGKENRDYITFDKIPKQVVDAVLATEDSRFYKHHGVDIFRLGGAVIANLTDGFGSQGASTITQQLVKRSFLTDEKTLKRKAQELWLSFQIERKYSKEEIFEMYINKIFYGANANGIATAARTYFDKDLKDLTLDEAATLAGLPQSPSRYNPFNNPERAEKRRNVVLSLMNQHGYISESEMKEAQNISIEKRLIPENKRGKDNTDPYDAFITQVIEEVEEKTDYNIFTDGLEVYTSMDPEAQEYVYNMLNTNDVINYPNEDLQAGVTLLDTQTGEIKALGGGRNKGVKRGLNYATSVERQPGSTIKPILDYGPAIEYKKWSTYQQIVDEPYSYSNGTKINNYNNRYQGQMSIRQALAKSLNIPALKAFQAAGKDNAQEFGERLGLDFKGEFEEAYSIGGMKTGVSTLEMAGAYSAFGNEGIYIEPHAVTKIVLGDKTTTIDLKPEPKVAMKDYTAFMVTDMLKTAVESGTGTAARVPGLDVAGKTGTTNFDENIKRKYNIPDGAVPDSWFVGYTTKYTAAIWTGYKDNKDYLGSASQQFAKKMFKSLMTEVSEGVHTKDFKKPNSVSKVAVEKGSNPAKKPGKFTPESNIVYEYFVKGTEPTAVSETYNKMEGPTGFNVAYDPEKKTLNLTWNYKTEDEQQKPMFELKGSIDGGAQTVLTTTGDMTFSIANPTPGSIYKFSLTAIVGDQKSDPATATIQIPKEDDKKDEQEPEDTENPDDKDDQNKPDDGGTVTPPDNGNQNPVTPPDNGNGDNNGNNNNGNGNGNNGSNNNGNSNGNNGNNSNGNGNSNAGGNNQGNNGQTSPNNGSATQNSLLQSIMFYRPFTSNIFSNLHFF